MRAFRLLRLSVIAFCVLLAMAMTLAFPLQESLPAVLREWSHSRPLRLTAFAAGMLALVGVGVGCVGLLVQKKWGAWVHFSSTALSVVADAGLGPHVMPTLSYAMEELLMLLCGLIYGLAFFTDALSADKKEPNQPPASPPSG